MNAPEYLELLSKDNRIYISENTRRFALMISSMAAQRLQEDVSPRGLSYHNGGIVLYYEIKVVNNPITLQMSLNLHHEPYKNLWTLIDKQTKNNKITFPNFINITGSVEEFDEIFCLIALNNIIPSEENIIFKLPELV